MCTTTWFYAIAAVLFVICFIAGKYYDYEDKNRKKCGWKLVADPYVYRRVKWIWIPSWKARLASFIWFGALFCGLATLATLHAHYEMISAQCHSL